MCKFIIACLISLSALSFSSCTQKKVATSVAYMDFPQTIELKARVQPLDTALFRYPFRVRVQGDKAVVMDLHGTDYFCHVFHYPGFRYFASFGKRGEAPEEICAGSLNFINDGLHEVLEQVDFVVRMNTLKNGGNTFQAHAGIHAGTGQLVHHAFFITVELHEHEVPNFHVAVAVFVGASGRASGNGGAVVIENFGARTSFFRSITIPATIASTVPTIPTITHFVIPWEVFHSTSQ